MSRPEESGLFFLEELTPREVWEADARRREAIGATVRAIPARPAATHWLTRLLRGWLSKFRRQKMHALTHAAPAPAADAPGIRELEEAAREATERDQAAQKTLAAFTQQLTAAQRGDVPGDIVQLMEDQQRAQQTALAVRIARDTAHGQLIRAQAQARSDAYRAELLGVVTRIGELVPTLQFELLRLQELLGARLNEASGFDIWKVTQLTPDFLPNLLHGIRGAVADTWVGRQAPNLELVKWLRQNVPVIDQAPKPPVNLMMIPRKPRDGETVEEYVDDYKQTLARAFEEVRAQQ